MIGSTQDISKLKQNEIELAKLNEQLIIQAKDLALSNNELENFAYVASHDLQEPLRMISSFLSQIEKKYGEILDEKGKKYIFFAVDGAKRMRQIILDLLEFSRVGRQELDVEEVNIRLIIDEILDLYKKQIEEKKALEEEKRLKHQEIIDHEYREARRQRQRDLQKKLPANQEVWREVAYLMTELTKLSNEERQWHNIASQHLDRTEAALVEQEKQLENVRQNLELSKDVANIDKPSETVLQIVGMATDSASDVTLAVDRIRNALHHVSNTVTECEQSRQQLYHQYVSNHQFYGYQGIHDPKGLLKALSQSQSED
jgi:signal transduction histidine kinase